MYELARRHRFLNKRSSHTEFEEAHRGFRCRMGQRSHHPEGDDHGRASELPLPNDDVLCNFCKFIISRSDEACANDMQTLAPAIDLNTIERSILPMMDKLVADDIPNIRFNVAKSYAVLINVLKRLPAEGTILSMEKSGQLPSPSPQCQKVIQQSILPNLEKLQQDDDVDVRYFATTAAGSVSDAMETS